MEILFNWVSPYLFFPPICYLLLLLLSFFFSFFPNCRGGFCELVRRHEPQKTVNTIAGRVRRQTFFFSFALVRPCAPVQNLSSSFAHLEGHTRNNHQCQSFLHGEGKSQSVSLKVKICGKMGGEGKEPPTLNADNVSIVYVCSYS